MTMTTKNIENRKGITMSIFKGTTPTLSLIFDEGTDLSKANHIVVTFATDYSKAILEKVDDELTVSGNTVEIAFTQAETLWFKPGKMLVQVNLLYSDGSRVASNIGTIHWVENLKDEVME